MVADPLRRTVTLEEYLALPEKEEGEVEVIRGRMYLAPNPFREHQWQLTELVVVVREHVVERGGDRHQILLDTDLIIRGRQTYVSPDLMYFSPETLEKLLTLPRGIIDVAETRPELVVEIVSPSTIRRDEREKPEEYAAAGIPHHWIFGPEPRRFRELVLDRNAAYVVVTDQMGGRVAPRLFALDTPPLVLDLDALAP